MWLLLSAVIVCLTIIVLFRMYVDLRRMDHQHIRMLQSDARDYERYVAVTERPKPRASMPNFTEHVERRLRELESERALDAFELEMLEQRAPQRSRPEPRSAAAIDYRHQENLRALSALTPDQLDALQDLTLMKFRALERDYPVGTQSPDSQPWIDPRMTEWMRDG